MSTPRYLLQDNNHRKSKNGNNAEYKGRIGNHRLLMGTDEINKLIQTGARMDEPRQQVLSEGMTTLQQAGIEKNFKGYCEL